MDRPDSSKAKAFTECLKNAYVCIIVDEGHSAVIFTSKVDICFVDYDYAFECSVFQKGPNIIERNECAGWVPGRTDKDELDAGV
jgi:hypothetical protein